MFIGRKKETKILREQLSNPTACVMLYGNRRVGKTSLLLEVTKDSPDKTIYFECYKGTLKYNALRFAEKTEELGSTIEKKYISDFVDVFKYLNGMNGTFNVIIDEYPFLKHTSKSDFVDSVFQNIVDNYIGNIRLFLCGSHVGMMKSLLNGDNALFGRFSLVMELEEWNYLEASECYKELTSYDKIALYSVFGGSPYINTAISPDKSLEENIKEMFLTKGAIAMNYTELLLATASSDAKGNTEAVLDAIGNNRKKYGEIKDITKVENDNTFNGQIKNAIYLGLLRKKFPINDTENNKQAWYEISDNILRFYYTFLHKKTDLIYSLGADTFYDTYIRPGLIDFISRRFEDICITFFSLQAKAGNLPGVMGIGRYSYNDRINKKNGEFDVVLKYKFSYDIYEVKYYKAPMTNKTIRAEKAQIEEIPGLRVDKIGFISVNGFTDDCEGILITGDDLYDDNIQ